MLHFRCGVPLSPVAYDGTSFLLDTSVLLRRTVLPPARPLCGGASAFPPPACAVAGMLTQDCAETGTAALAELLV